MFLTPYIIRDEADYRRIYEKKRKEQQEFIEQFYGRQPRFEVEVDFARKAGPFARMRAGVIEETSRLENGGRGGPNERVTAPPGGAPAPQGAQPAPGAPAQPPRATPVPRRGDPSLQNEGTPVDRLELQPEVPSPAAPPEAPPAPPQGEPAPPQGGAPPAQ